LSVAVKGESEPPISSSATRKFLSGVLKFPGDIPVFKEGNDIYGLNPSAFLCSSIHKKARIFFALLSPQMVHRRTLFQPRLLPADDEEHSGREVMVPGSTGLDKSAY
jgi:hypothetical protein